LEEAVVVGEGSEVEAVVVGGLKAEAMAMADGGGFEAKVVEVVVVGCLEVEAMAVAIIGGFEVEAVVVE
jgi:hypothetical protein